MITFAKFASAVIDAGKRILKVEQFGAKTANEAMPFGDDSQPLADFIAIMADTSNIGEPVIIGYINKNQVAGPGEKRLYSLKGDGSESAYIWLKNNETLELNGSAHNIVRYTPLKAGIDAKDALIVAELAKIATAISSLGGVYVPGNISTDISNSKVDNVKTN